MKSIYVQVVQRSPEHRLLARFLPRPPGARRFRSFDKVGRPQLPSHSCASSNVGSTHASCGLLIYIAEETCACMHRPVVAANYAAAAAASWAAAAAAPDASFPASAAAAASPICVWGSCALISLIICCVPSHSRGEITATGNFTYMQTLVESERFLIDDWCDHLYGYTLRAL